MNMQSKTYYNLHRLNLIEQLFPETQKCMKKVAVILGSGAFFLGLFTYLYNEEDSKPKPPEKIKQSQDKSDFTELQNISRSEHDLEPKRRPLTSQISKPKIIVLDGSSRNPVRNTLHPSFIERFLENSKFRFTIDCNGNNVGSLANHQQMIEFVENAARGIMTEAKLWGKNHPGEIKSAEDAAAFIADELLEQIEENPFAIFKVAVRLFTMDTFLNKVVHDTFTGEDLSKADTLGPFCYLLNAFIMMTSAKIRNENIPTQMYRYTGKVYKVALLDPEDVEQYKALLGHETEIEQNGQKRKNKKLFSWSSINCTTSSEGAAFGWIMAFKMNTLFEIYLDEQSAFCGSDARNISAVRMELEVHVPMQATYEVVKIEKVADPRYPSLQYKISLRTDGDEGAFIQTSPVCF